jgi:hypothetical protein
MQSKLNPKPNRPTIVKIKSTERPQAEPSPAAAESAAPAEEQSPPTEASPAEPPAPKQPKPLEEVTVGDRTLRIGETIDVIPPWSSQKVVVTITGFYRSSDSWWVQYTSSDEVPPGWTWSCGVKRLT